MSAIVINQFAVADTFSGMIIQWLGNAAYSGSVNTASVFVDTIDDTMKVNPSEWNLKMYQSLLDYYGNSENVNFQTVY
jgi:hypothetical protein